MSHPSNETVSFPTDLHLVVSDVLSVDGGLGHLDPGHGELLLPALEGQLEDDGAESDAVLALEALVLPVDRDGEVGGPGAAAALDGGRGLVEHDLVLDLLGVGRGVDGHDDAGVDLVGERELM